MTSVLLSRQAVARGIDVAESNEEDDPDVFTFASTHGLIKGPTLELNSSGACVPGASAAVAVEAISTLTTTTTTTSKKVIREPFKIKLDFRPTNDVKYRSRFRFHVAGGVAVDAIVSGGGSLEEGDVTMM